MDAGLLAQYTMNGLMLGMMYALVAVGFTLFFGVLDVIKFSPGDVVTVGAFSSLGAAGLAGGLVALPPVLALVEMALLRERRRSSRIAALEPVSLSGVTTRAGQLLRKLRRRHEGAASANSSEGSPS